MIGALPPTPIQYSLPKMPKQAADALPVHMALRRACATRFVEAGWLSISARVLPLVADMRLDDVLYFGGVWRVELVWLNSGYPHYRLYWMPKRHHVFGIADIHLDSAEGVKVKSDGSIEVKVLYGAEIGRAPRLKAVQSHLAAYLAVFGATPENTKLVRGVAWTPLNADTSRQYRLFRVRGE